jgi:cytochrome P450 family 6
MQHFVDLIARKMFEYLGLIIACVYLVIRFFYSHWERRKFPYIKPVIPFGNLRLVVQKKRSFGTAIYDLYTSTKEPFIGIYLFWRPALLVRDAELAKRILVKDFASFHDRGVYVDEVNDPMSGNLFSLEGEKWKKLRQQLSPTFTSGKLKNMMPTIMKVANELQDYLRPMVEKGEIIEMNHLMSRYVIDIIASVIFGCDVNTIRNPNDEFRSIGKSLNTGFFQAIRGMAVFLCPR